MRDKHEDVKKESNYYKEDGAIPEIRFLSHKEAKKMQDWARKEHARAFAILKDR